MLISSEDYKRRKLITIKIIVVTMEIKILNIENSENKSHFKLMSEMLKKKEIQLSYNQINEYLADPEYSFKNCKFENILNGKLYLDYPLNVICEVNVQVETLNDLISQISKAYHQIYKEININNKYGVWGHSIYDLSINSIKIYTDNSIVVDLDS